MLVTYASALWQLARPRTLIVIWLHFLLIYAYISESTPPLWSMVLAFITMTASYINAASINDSADVEADKINLPKQNQAGDRPIVNGTLRATHVRTVAIFSGLITLVGCTLLNPWLLVVGALVLGFNTIYSTTKVKLSGRGALAQYLLPLVYVLYPASLALTIAQVGLTIETASLIGGLYMIFVGRLFLKDIRDEEGDRATGKQTVVVRRGVGYSVRMSAMWQIIGVATMTASLLSTGAEPLIVVPIVLVTLLGILGALYRCVHVAQLEEQLLWIACSGRFASMWVFVWVVLSAIPTASFARRVLVATLAVTLFFIGIGMLYEEIQSVRRRISRESS